MAHCFQQKLMPRKMDVETIYVSFGCLNLTSKCKDDAIKASVSEIFIHPDWNVSAFNYDADIAIVRVTNVVSFSTNVTSIRIQSTYKDFLTIGTIVGWGRSEISDPFDPTDHEKMSKEMAMRAVMNEDCFLDFPQLLNIGSRRTFCAGWPGINANVCNGDSGEPAF